MRATPLRHTNLSQSDWYFASIRRYKADGGHLQLGDSGGATYQTLQSSWDMTKGVPKEDRLTRVIRPVFSFHVEVFFFPADPLPTNGWEDLLCESTTSSFCPTRVVCTGLRGPTYTSVLWYDTWSSPVCLTISMRARQPPTSTCRTAKTIPTFKITINV